jgi:hypothetical protein
MANIRQYLNRHSRLELNGQDAGTLRSVEGGEPYGTVVEDVPKGQTAVVGKRLGIVQYTDITIECSLTPSVPLASWIVETLGGSATMRNGAIVEVADDKEASRLTFQNAFIREIGFPALDAADKSQIYLTLRIASEWIRRQAGSGAPSRQDPSARPKTHAASAFKLRVDGLASTSVSDIGPLVVRQVRDESPVGELRPTSWQLRLEFPDLVVTLPEAEDWYAWRDAFILDGRGPERTGTLEYLTHDMSTALARIEFTGLGIHSLVRQRLDERTEGVRRIRASMYCESLSYHGPPTTVASTSGEARLVRPSRVDVTPPLRPSLVRTSRA